MEKLLIIVCLLLAVPGWCGEVHTCPMCQGTFESEIFPCMRNDEEICVSCFDRAMGSEVKRSIPTIELRNDPAFDAILAELRAIRKLLEELQRKPEWPCSGLGFKKDDAVDYPLLHPEIWDFDASWNTLRIKNLPELKGMWFWNKIYFRWECWKGNKRLDGGGK